MAVVPVTINGVAYPKTKEAGAKPFPVTIVGYAWITGLEVGGGPIIPPDEVPPVDPPLVIWGGGNEPFPTPPIVIPPPPDKPPSPPEKPHEGWNWSQAKSGWYFLYVPDAGQAQPKK